MQHTFSYFTTNRVQYNALHCQAIFANIENIISLNRLLTHGFLFFFFLTGSGVFYMSIAMQISKIKFICLLTFTVQKFRNKSKFKLEKLISYLWNVIS